MTPGGSNIQFSMNPENGRICVIEMNPRVSRSSALASKATGFPIAKIAALLSVGYTLDEIPNDITKETPASFEPTIDYVVVKIPRFTFEKFPGAEPTLTTQMKSVGEVMAIGRSFKESLGKALRSLETGSPVPMSKMRWARRSYTMKRLLKQIKKHIKIPTDGEDLFCRHVIEPRCIDRRDLRPYAYRPVVPRKAKRYCRYRG